MKFDERRFPDLLRNVASYRVILLHGDDASLVSSRARTLAEAASAGSVSLFGVAEFDGSEHAQALTELSSPVLGGGLRLVRLRNTGDAATASVEAALGAGSGALLLAEAGPLPAKSRLRAAVEGSREGAAVACWAMEKRDLAGEIDKVVESYGVSMAPDARQLLMEMSEGYGAAMQNAEKAALLVGESGQVTSADILALQQEGQSGAMDALVFAVTSGRVDETDRALEGLLQDAAAPVGLIRALLGHLARVRMARLAVDGGSDPGAAVSGLRPPVFFRRAPDMRRAVSVWPAPLLQRACDVAWRADLQCRQTGAPVAAICRHAIQTVLRLCPDAARRS